MRTKFRYFCVAEKIGPCDADAFSAGHALQDEFIYVLEGMPTLVTDAGETPLAPGLCAGFRAGSGDAHQLANRSDADVLYLEIGDRTPGDSASYPDDDLAGRQVDGEWRFVHSDGTPY
jgi:uncharacterized cupin superfamily protein